MDIFRGELVRLAAVDKDSIAAGTRWMSDYEVRRLADDEAAGPMTEDAQREWYERAAKSDGDFSFAIRTLDDDALIGNCGLYGISHKNGSAEFGIVIGEKGYWGRGFGTDATRVLLRFAFWELNLHRVELEVFAFNERAIRAYEKAGFVREGARREATFREGRYHDVLVMSILRGEWDG